MKKFIEWFIINDIVKIRKYGLVSHLKYLFSYAKTIVHIQIDLNRLQKLPDISPLIVRELSLNDENDLNTWADIIYLAFDEEQYDALLAKDKLTNHDFLKVKKVFLVFDGTKCIGTVSAAVFKSNPNIASGCRFAVHPDYQGKGLGKYLYLLILHVLKDEGYNYFESTMAIKRETSFIVKFKLGFYPQLNRRYVQYKNQKRFFLVRLAANYRLYRLWRQYKKTINEKYLTG
ncbi:MAG: GNAT family N-acetyltransferase [Bacteroidales bacterium]|nr:GNAT family N-acetyltransferase [Bacteroidales bacterium]